MLMTRDELARVAKNLRETIDARMNAFETLKAHVGKPYGDEVDAKHQGEEYVEVKPHPQRAGAFVIHYFRRTGQTPIMAIFNPAAKNIKLSVTCVEPIDGYAVFEEDEFGLMQDRELPGLDFAILRAELDALAGGAGSAPATGAGPQGKLFQITPVSAKILCSVCGGPASRLKVGMYPGDNDHFVYFDMRDDQKWTFSASDTEEMWKFVNAQDLRGLQQYLLDEIASRPVLDAYCPKCNAAYCRDHHRAHACAPGNGKKSVKAGLAPKRNKAAPAAAKKSPPVCKPRR